MATKDYHRYWGKAAKLDEAGSPDYHLLPYHCLDVAAVGFLLLDPSSSRNAHIAQQLKVDPIWLQRWFAFCLSLHDLGKFCRSFQNLAPNLSPALVPAAGCANSVRHDSLGIGMWQNVLIQRTSDLFHSTNSKTITGWLEVVFGHHGHPPNQNLGRQIKRHCLEEDELAAESFFRDASSLLMPELTPLKDIDRSVFRSASWNLAGLAVLADWLGSNQSVFPYRAGSLSIDDYWHSVALPQSAEAVKMAALNTCSVARFTGIQQHFDFVEEPTPLQNMASSISLGHGPNLFILEDVTGSGKTEAAMVLVHRLMEAKKANGVYFGLPTMATSNAMYERLSDCYAGFFDEQSLPSLVLAHSASRLSDSFAQSVGLSAQTADLQNEPQAATASAYCNEWLADNRKKALLANVGVGTIDQALIGVLPARHQSLRLHGLHDKVLVVDEVHAYDPYMQKLLSNLLAAHARQGGSAILLSATLPHSHRSELLQAYADGLGSELPPTAAKSAYPLMTQLSQEGIAEHEIDTRAEVRRTVNITRLDSEEVVMQVVREAVSAGSCVCWVRNTVRDAKRAFQSLQNQEWLSCGQINLFHSRYAMIDRQRIETNVLNRFGKSSKADDRVGQVLIATQVAEQSLDLDFDVMISDLAPIDLLIQRAGRLQRHVRDAQGNPKPNGKEQREPAHLFILSPDPAVVSDADWLKSLLPGTQAVYSNVGELWRTIRALLHHGLEMPELARELVESVYGEGNSIPEPLDRPTSNAEVEQKVKSGLAEFNKLRLELGYTWKSANNNHWDEDVNIPTRLGAETCDIALAREENGKLVPYARGVARPWAMSQLSVPLREWKMVADLIPENYREQIELLKEQTPALKWLEVLPLELSGCFYSASDGWLGAERPH